MDDQRLDDDLANLTDAVLENRTVMPSDDLKAYEAVVRQLKSVIEPDSYPSPQFRDRLTQRIKEEWTINRQTQQPRLFLSRPMRIAALAASVAVVLLGVALTLNSLNTSEGEQPVGTALGDANWAVFALMAIGGIAALVVLWRGRR